MLKVLLIGHSLEEIVISRDTVIFLLKHLGFVINWKKSVLTPVKEIEFLDLTIKYVKNSESGFIIPEFIKQSTNISSGVDQVDWFVDVNYSNSFTNKVELSFSSNTTNISFIGKPFLFRQNCFEQKLKNQTEMVGTKLRAVQWSNINLTVCRGVNTDRHFNKKPGGAMESHQGRCGLLRK